MYGTKKDAKTTKAQLSESPPAAAQEEEMAAKMNAKPLGEYPQRLVAFISLGLGFLLIWTTVLAGVLVSKTYNDNVNAVEAVKVFHTHDIWDESHSHLAMKWYQPLIGF